jgi:hypothetical protein
LFSEGKITIVHITAEKRKKVQKGCQTNISRRLTERRYLDERHNIFKFTFVLHGLWQKVEIPLPMH